MLSCGVCVSMCLFLLTQLTNLTDIERNFFTISSIQAILIFPCQTGWQYSDRNPRNRGVGCRWCGKKTRCTHCIQVYSIVNRTSRSVKNKAANVGKRRAEHSRRRPSPFFAQDEDELFVTGSTLYAGDGGQIPLQTRPPWS